jgi:hypothetical protein
MATGFLIDSNIIIDFSAKKLAGKQHEYVAEIIDNFPQISVNNKIELLGFEVVPPQIKLFIDQVSIIGLDDEVVDLTIALRKEYKIKLPDAIIAATALVNDLTIVTNNIKDFSNISGLQLINPYSIT